MGIRRRYGHWLPHHLKRMSAFDKHHISLDLKYHWQKDTSSFCVTSRKKNLSSIGRLFEQSWFTKGYAFDLEPNKSNSIPQKVTAEDLPVSTCTA